MKRILIQLDTDTNASPFDAIVAHDAGVDVVLPCSAVIPSAVRNLVQSAFFTRGVDDLAAMAVWVGGSDVKRGERILEAVKEAYFGSFRISAMLDCNGCNTTAATAIAMLARRFALAGRHALIIGAGPVGLRSASLLTARGASVTVSSIPPDFFGNGNPYRAPVGLTLAQQFGIRVAEPASRPDLARLLDGASIVLCAGPAGLQLLSEEEWFDHPDVEILADYNAAEPLGIEGVRARDALVERHGKTVLGALGVGDLKMRVHKACVRRLFERNDVVLDVDGVYGVAAGIA
jgi:methylenetetrahydrofolate/methylenetetrahydromethanopterin dehydrogenase (NADP+)